MGFMPSCQKHSCEEKLFYDVATPLTKSFWRKIHTDSSTIRRVCQSDSLLALFHRMLEGKFMNNALFQHFGGRFGVVWHNLNSFQTSQYCGNSKYYTKPRIKSHNGIFLLYFHFNSIMTFRTHVNRKHVKENIIRLKSNFVFSLILWIQQLKPWFQWCRRWCASRVWKEWYYTFITLYKENSIKTS